MSIKFWKHQLKTIAYAESRERWYNASDPGTGKTLAILGYIAKHNLKSLILAPKTLLEPAWLADWKKILPEDEVTIAWASNREKAFNLGTPSVITNIEAVNWLAKRENLHHLRRFDLVVCDEATAFRVPSSMRSKNARGVFDRVPKAICMSGTPRVSSVQDLWHQYFLLDHGQRLGPSITRFRYRFCKPFRPPGAPQGVIKWLDRDGAMDEVAELVADITLRFRIDECLDIPPNHVEYLPAKLSPKLHKAYDTLAKESRVLLASGEKVDLLVLNGLRNKLLQLCSGAVYTGDGEAGLVSDERYELTADLIDAREASVVFFVWRHQREGMERALKKRKLPYAVIDGTVNRSERGRLVEEFQKGKYRAILLHPATGAHGLTLTRAKTVIFTCPPADRPDWMEQGIARIVRGGQDSKTETILLYAPGTLERSVYEAIQSNCDVNETFVNYLQKLGGA